MVQDQIQARGISDPAVLTAMTKVKRHLFVDEALQSRAYGDYPLPVGHGQTISQPYIVALMSSLLEVQPGMKVLEVGAGSGYQAAVLAEMGAEVFSVERLKPLYAAAQKRLMAMRLFSVRLKLDDGTLGWPEESPFDRILVSAGGPEVPPPLLDQLKDPGILVMPVGGAKQSQTLVKVCKQAGALTREEKGDVVFVDLVGTYGW